MLRRLGWPAALLAVLTVGGGCGVPDPPKILPPNIDGNTLPPAALAALDHKWPKRTWSHAAIDPQAAACLPPNAPPKAVLTSDLDSDGMSDIAIAVGTSTGTRLVVLMARTWGYDVYDVDSLGDKAAAAGLALEPRGKRFVNADTSGVNNYSSDTLTAFPCGKNPVSYIWDGFGFYKINIGKGTK